MNVQKSVSAPQVWITSLTYAIEKWFSRLLGIPFVYNPSLLAGLRYTMAKSQEMRLFPHASHLSLTGPCQKSWLAAHDATGVCVRARVWVLNRNQCNPFSTLVENGKDCYTQSNDMRKEGYLRHLCAYTNIFLSWKMIPTTYVRVASSDRRDSY